MRDKTFFFLASEAYRQNWGYPASGDVPSAALTATRSEQPRPCTAIIKAFPGAGPKTAEYATSDPNTNIVICNCTQVVNESSFMLRLDQHFSAKTTGFMRFNYDRSVNTQPLSATATDLQQKVSTPVNGVLELLHVFNSTFVNEAHAGFNRSTNNQYNNSDTGIIYKIAVQNGVGAGICHRELRLHQHLRGQLVFGERQPDLDAWPAYVQSRRGVPPHSNEPGSPGRRNRLRFPRWRIWRRTRSEKRV